MNDKIQHFLVGFVLTLCGFVWLPLIILGFGAGIFKEVYDHHKKNSWDNKDLIATFCGAVIASIIVLMIR